MTVSQPFSSRQPTTEAAVYPVESGAVPPSVIEAGRYQVRFARSPDDLDRILALRYQIFNLELGEGLDQSHHTGRDEDELDSRMHHLMILDRRSGFVVGTYRMQTAEMAHRLGGFYSAQEFDLSQLPPDVVRSSVEIGRACVARDHRNGRVLSLLWRGLAEYLVWNQKHFLFGCCSLTTQDPDLGADTHAHLEHLGAVHLHYRVFPRDGMACTRTRPALHGPAHIPALFQSYLNLGAKVLGPPAIDRSFKTIDWLVMLDVREFDPMTYRHFFR